MEIYVLRHGIAEPGDGSDADRALTDEGRKKLRRVLERAAKAGVAPSLILTSPLKRAVQTADTAAAILQYRGKVVPTNALAPDATPEQLWDEIRAHKDESAVLLAGHEPMLSASVAWLLGFPGLQVEMKKGALARIDVDRFGPQPRGVLRWLLPSRLAGGE